MRAHNTHLLQVQLTEAEKRDIKALAASQGLTLRQATLHAFEAWVAELRSRALPANPARGTAAGAEVQKPGQAKGAATPRQDQRPAGGKPPLARDDGPVPGLSASSRAWLHRATQLDWSKCPAVHRVPGKTGNVWVVRGTDAPLDEVLQSVADGQPFLEIAEVFEITLQQLTAVLQFAVQGGEKAAFTTEAQRTQS